MLGIEVDILAATAFLDTVIEGVEGAGAMTMLGGLLVEQVAAAFATEGFGAWAPLSPATVAAKGSGRILVDTGALLAELTTPAGVVVDGDSVTVDSTEIGGVMAARGARGAPVRNPTPVPPTPVLDDWATQYAGGLLGGFR